LLCSTAQATEVNYSAIGWWQIKFGTVDNLSGCLAEARFQDQTKIEMALIEQGNTKSWTFFVSNPRWNSWISRKKQHTLIVAAVNPTRVWRDVWSTTDDNSLYLNASVDFMNSIADANTLAILDDNRHLLTAPLDMKDSEPAIKAAVNCVREHAQNPAPSPEVRVQPPAPETTYSGTAFYISPNLLLTNNHVIKDCGRNLQVRYPERTSYTATISSQDDTNDLALIRTDMSSQSIASFRFRPRLGEAVATYGFPYSSLLSSSGNFTLGNVTSLSGIKDDSRFIQISTPVQPGNSGGPLLDAFGNVVGIVVGQLSAVTMMQVLGSVPQNVNFAIQAPIVVNFLSTRDIAPKMDSSETHRDLPWSDVADLAKKFTVQVHCEGGPGPNRDAAPVAPPSVPPSSKNIAPTIEKQAKEFVLALEAKWSRPNDEAIAGLDAIYNDEVMYFGKRSTRDEVIKEKRAFARKFPEREYRLREPISVSCSERNCTVRGLLDFRSVDPAARIVSEGVATFEYQLTMSEGPVRITLEAGEVLKRNKTPLHEHAD
jgi:serine protease Do